MRAIDRTAIEEIGIPGVVLMENAGLRIVRALKARFPEIAGERIVVVAGKGNNGGRRFRRRPPSLQFRRAGPRSCSWRPEARSRATPRSTWPSPSRSGIPVTEVRDAAAWKKARVVVLPRLDRVDALFGTGLAKPLDGLFAAGGRGHQPGARPSRSAVDIPSGLSADTFEIIGPSVKADLTVTLAAPKIAHIFPPAADRVGELVVAPIGIPPALFDDPELKLELVEERAVRPYFARRKTGHAQGELRPSPHLRRVARQVGRGRAGRAGRAAHGGRPGHRGHGRRRPAVDRPVYGRAHDRAAGRNAGKDDRGGGAAARPRPAQGQERRSHRARTLDPSVDRRVRARPPAQDQGAVRHRRRRAQHRRLAPGRSGRPRGPGRPHAASRASSPGSSAGRTTRSSAIGWSSPRSSRRNTTSSSSSRAIGPSSPRPTAASSSTRRGTRAWPPAGPGDVLGGMIGAADRPEERPARGRPVGRLRPRPGRRRGRGQAGREGARRRRPHPVPAAGPEGAGRANERGRPRGHDPLRGGDLRAGPDDGRPASRGRRSSCSSGELGAGKTVFAKGLAAGAGVADTGRVSSPSFTLVNVYEGKHPASSTSISTGSSGRPRSPTSAGRTCSGRGSSSSSGPRS